MKRVIFVLLVLGLSLTPAFAQEPERLVLGMMPSLEAERLVDTLEPLAEMLGERLGVPVDAFVATSYTGLVEAMGTGRVDMGLFGPTALVQAVERHDASFILESVRHGEASYRAQFNVHHDSDIESFEDLRGRTIAFVDPASASGYQFPYAFLLSEHGIDADADMQAIFAGSHDAAVFAVYNRDVDVGVSFEDARTMLEADFPDVKEEVRALGYTVGIPNGGMVVRAGMPAALAQRIAGAMIDIVQTDEGRALTEAIFNITDFALVGDERYDEAYAIVRETMDIFGR
jgi:phosphonate transport system substrate-binding protein